MDRMKTVNIGIIGNLGEEKEKVTTSIFKDNYCKLPKPGERVHTQIHEVQTTPNRLNLNRATMKHIIIKLSEVKEKNFKAEERERSNIQGNQYNAVSRSVNSKF